MDFGQAVMFTMTFDLQSSVMVPSIAGSFPLSLAAIATLSLSVEGVQVRRVIDVVQGTSISGVAQAIVVKMKDNAPPGTPSGVPYLVTVLGAPYPRPGSFNPPTYTPNPPVTVPPAPASVSISVPQGVGANSIQLCAASFIDGATINGIVRAQYISEGGDPFDLKIWQLTAIPQFIALPPGVQRILVQNLDPANAIQISATYGIDG
jgi:hypothetical protein